MKLFKLIPLMALALAVTVNCAMADVGQVPASKKDEINGEMCEFSPAAVKAKAATQAELKKEPARQAEPAAQSATVAM